MTLSFLASGYDESPVSGSLGVKRVFVYVCRLIGKAKRTFHTTKFGLCGVKHFSPNAESLLISIL